MPRRTRPRRGPTDDYEQLALWANGPEHRAFALIRPVVLFDQSPAVRARETGCPGRKLHPVTSGPYGGQLYNKLCQRSWYSLTRHVQQRPVYSSKGGSFFL